MNIIISAFFKSIIFFALAFKILAKKAMARIMIMIKTATRILGAKK